VKSIADENANAKEDAHCYSMPVRLLFCLLLFPVLFRRVSESDEEKKLRSTHNTELVSLRVLVFSTSFLSRLFFAFSKKTEREREINC